jgi:DNA polymerase-3 subunit gamma/tau
MAGDAPRKAAPRKKPARPGAPVGPAPLALYRKYRPASFAEVKGQEHVTEPLRQALRNGRINHAYLFSGPRGCGKTSSARILARSLNCEQGPTPDPCGVCASCVALAPSGPGSIDVIEIDAASHGGVDDARDLRERAFYAPVSGRFKIYIIDEAHMVTREGFNALLKLVEEPPPHLKFVFATTEPEKVIATIRSRTHHYPFRLVPPAVLRELLEEILRAEKVKYQPAVLPLVVRAGAGSVRDALSVLDQLLGGAAEEGLTYDRTVALLGYTDDSLLDEMVDAFAGGDGAAVFGAVDRVVEGGHDPRRFAADLLDRFRDLIILAAVPGAGQTGLLDAPADRLEGMAEQAGRFGQAELTRAAEILSEGLIQMRGTTSPRLLLELVCAQVLLPAASTGEKALLARLERLEHQLAGAGQGHAEPADRPARPAEQPVETSQQAGPGGAAQSAPHRVTTDPTDADRGGAAQSAPHRVTSDRTDANQGTPRDGDRSGDDASRTRERPVAGTGQGRGTARMDADALRERWPDILDAVRGERKVAWMLLNSASVQDLENGILTIAFPSEGNARGFAGSGHEQVLTGTLAAMLGLNVRVRAVVGAPPAAQAHSAGAGPVGGPAQPPQPGQGGQGGASRPPAPDPHAPDPHAPDPHAPDPAAPSVPARSGPAPSDSDPAASSPPTSGPPGAGHPGTGPPASGPPGTGHPEAGQPAAPRQGRPARGQGGAPDNGRRTDRAAGGPPPGATRPSGAGQRPEPAQPSQPRVPPSPPATALADEDWPDDTPGPGGAAADLTGMELIQRQLGGRVIGEIEES